MFTTSQICQMLNGQLIGDSSLVISGPSKIEEGKQGTITFLANPKYESFIYESKASAIIVSKDFTPEKQITPTLIKVDDVYQSLSILLEFYNKHQNRPKGISSLAFVSPKATLDEDVAIDHYVVVEENCVLKSGTVIYANAYIGRNVKVGSNCILYPGVTLYDDTIIGNNVVIHANSVIGSDGFGFARSENTYKKIPQIGNVVIEDNVEIGANTVIDRASIGSTIIRQGVKLDNLIQIAHNVEIDENTAIAAQTGIAGSTRVGKDCIIGGQVGLAGHISIADGTMIQAKSGISSNVKEKNSKLYGYPALDYGSYLKSYAYFKKLPEMADKIRQLELQLQKLINKDE